MTLMLTFLYKEPTHLPLSLFSWFCTSLLFVLFPWGMVAKFFVADDLPRFLVFTLIYLVVSNDLMSLELHGIIIPLPIRKF